MSSAPKANSLSFLLLKDAYKSLNAALKDAGKCKISSAEVNGQTFFLATKSPTNRSPKWLAVFGGNFSADLQSLYSASSSAILAYSVNDRWFAIPFGYGRSLLSPGTYEENFGLKVVLNSVKFDKLRSIDAKSLEAISINQRSQASKATDLGDFGIDIERDMLCAATGESDSKELGKIITGKDALKVVLPITLKDFPEFSEFLLDKFESEKYKERFPWIDNLLEVRDPTLSSELNEILIAKIRDDSLSASWLTIPDVIEWEQVEGFKFGGQRKPLHEDIDWNGLFADVCKREDMYIDALKKQNIICISRENGEIQHQWPIYRCIYAEVEKSQKTYILNNGHWYCVEQDFLKALNAFYTSIPKSDVVIPRYNHKDEGAYNLDVTSDTNLALCDKKNISHGGGYNKVEFCDLFTLDGKIIHVKRYGGSSVLSHLFAQGLVSARLFLTDAEFRKKVRNILPETHKKLIPSGKPSPEKFGIVFAVISNSNEETLSIPLFSKITLKHAATTLQAMGLEVSLLVIPSDKDLSVPDEKCEE